MIEKNQIKKSRKKLIEYKKQLKLTSRQKEIAVGLLLGDVSIQSQDQSKTYRLKFEIGNKNKKYAEVLWTEFEEWCLSPIRYNPRTNKNGNLVITWTFQTISHHEFKWLAEIFLNTVEKKRILPNLVDQFLTEIGLAYWFMDDGSKMDHTSNEGKGIHLHTQCFTPDEVDFLCSSLTEKFQLKCWRGNNKNKPIVVISGESFEKFLLLVKPHIIESMKYKLPSFRKKKKRKN